MKKYALTSFAFIFCSLFYSQDPITLKADLTSKQLSDPTSNELELNKSYGLKISGINTAFITVKVETADYNFVSSTPDLLKLYLLNVQDSGALALIKKDDGKEAAGASYYERIYSNALIHIDKLSLLANLTNELYGESNDDEEFRTDTLVRAIRKKAKEHLKVILNAFPKIELGRNNTSTEDGLNNGTSSVLSKKEDTIQIIKTSMAYSARYIESATTYFKGLIENQRLTESETVDHELLALFSHLSVLTKDVDYETSLKYLNFLLKSTKMENFKEFDDVLKVSNDVLEMKVILTNTYTNDTILSKTIDFYPRYGGFKFDFSTGFFFNTISEKSYYLENESPERNTIIEENGDEFDIAVGALGHISYQLSSGLRGGVNFGAALSPMDGITRYLFGAGVLIGKEKLIGINAGTSVARVDVLSNLVQSDGQGLFVPVEVTSIPTFKKSEWGFFFGLTYNLTRQRKK